MHRATPLSRLTPTIPHCAEVDVTGGSFPMSGHEALWETSPGSVLGAQPDSSPLARRVYGSHRILCSKMLGLTGREGARLGTQFGWECQFCAHALGLKEVGLVRAGRVSGRKSSKRVQTGEPNTSFSGRRHSCVRTLRRSVPNSAADLHRSGFSRSRVHFPRRLPVGRLNHLRSARSTARRCFSSAGSILAALMVPPARSVRNRIYVCPTAGLCSVAAAGSF